jgi:hypothetical protein
MRALLVFLAGLLIGAGSVYLWLTKDGAATAPQVSSVAVERGPEVAPPPTPHAEAEEAGGRPTVRERLEQWGLGPEDIRREMARAGRVVRETSQDAGERIADSVSDARIVTSIKWRLARDPQLSAWDIRVSSRDGRVSLSGKAPSQEAIGRAIMHALDTEGVSEVTSTIQAPEGKAQAES